MSNAPDKRPKKGILKNSKSFEQKRAKSQKSKETKWDEMNIIATLHPPDKEYGHMKIDEPKTPYNFEYDTDQQDGFALDPSVLAEKLKSGGKAPPKAMASLDSIDDEELTPEQRAQRREFENRRKKHYNEYQAVKMARKLLEEEEDEDDNKAGTSRAANHLGEPDSEVNMDCCEREECPRRAESD